MNKKTVLVATITLLIGGISGYVVARTENPFAHKMPIGTHQMSDESLMSNTDNNIDMASMDHSDHMMNMMVSSEREFIEGMIPHHQEAVDTAKEVIERGGTTPQIKKLAEGIVVAQEKEIADMKSWYQAWHGTPYQGTGTYMPMMRELGTLSGTALDRVFLEDMIMHHMGAIMMARSVGPHIEHDEIASLVEAIATTQSAEIADMQQMLEGL